MRHTNKEPAFENRYDAGHKLAEKLLAYKGRPVVVMGIPNGGAPVALNIALRLEADFDLVISRKIPLPLSPEGGFGAVTDDGTTILNETMVKQAGLTPQQINYQASKVRADIRQRSLLYHQEKPPALTSEKTVIVVDDGMASGYTMMAAVESLRHRHPREIVVAVPVAHEKTIKEVSKRADKVIAVVVDSSPKFYLADFYRFWNEPSDKEVLQCFKEWRIRRRPAIDLTIKSRPTG
ncbi:MAG: phosphoribosyltransferase family protein [Dehalococcoidales bacterium]|nr:phosphoribosyltransferase family protein [Dehalococcoidales bacterium]